MPAVSDEKGTLIVGAAAVVARAWAVTSVDGP
jgi:hypothetical protein